MRRIEGRAPEGTTAAAVVTLSFDARRRSRQRLVLDDGSEAALILPRGSVLVDGDRLLADDGLVVSVKAAVEALSVARTADRLRLARAAYHLGNRHVALEVRDGEVRYRQDEVLDEMVRGLGLAVEPVSEPFEGEGGAYDHGHGHGLLIRE